MRTYFRIFSGQMRDLPKSCGRILLLLLHVFCFCLGVGAQEKGAQLLGVLPPPSTNFFTDMIGIFASVVPPLSFGVRMKKGQQTVKKRTIFLGILFTYNRNIHLSGITEVQFTELSSKFHICKFRFLFVCTNLTNVHPFVQYCHSLMLAMYMVFPSEFPLSHSPLLQEMWIECWDCVPSECLKALKGKKNLGLDSTLNAKKVCPLSFQMWLSNRAHSKGHRD